MLAQIPILINRKGSNAQQQAFKILPLDKKANVSHRRQKTYDSKEKPLHQQRQHDTLDSQRSKGQCRYRRISSSGAVNKFPKDFFRADLPSTPMKIRFSRSKKQNHLQSLSFSKVKFKEDEISYSKKQQRKYKIQSPETEIEKVNLVQTPKFNNKIFNQNQLFEANSKTTNRKMKIQEYLSHKKQVFATFFACSPFEEIKMTGNVLLEKKQSYQIKDQQNNANQMLFETLNGKQNFNIVPENINKKLTIKKKISNQNKENDQEIKSQRKPIVKNVNKFLSSKGFNWKIMKKFSSQKPKSKDIKFCKKQNIFGENRKMIAKLIKKQLEDNPTQFQENLFRIRKFT